MRAVVIKLSLEKDLRLLPPARGIFRFSWMWFSFFAAMKARFETQHNAWGVAAKKKFFARLNTAGLAIRPYLGVDTIKGEGGYSLTVSPWRAGLTLPS